MALPTPIAYWPFDENNARPWEGGSAADLSGNGHTVTLVFAGHFDNLHHKFGPSGLGNYYGQRAGSIVPMNLGTVHSFSCWFNDWQNEDGVLMGGPPAHYIVYFDPSYTRLSYAAGGPATNHPYSGGRAALLGLHHLVVTRNNTTVTMYKDGVLLSAQTLSANTPLILSAFLSYDYGNAYWTGTIDDVRLYTVELTAAQVTELYGLTPGVVPERSQATVSV